VWSGVQVDETPLEKLSPEELKARKEEWKRRKNEAPVAGTKKGSEGTPAAPAPKLYSEGEREKAWKGFKETIHTKE
jgi:hypothetical protein